MFSVSSPIFELAIANPNSPNFVEDNVYYGLSVYTENKAKDAATMDKVALAKADVAMDTVIAATPNYQEAYLYKARINNSLGNDEIMATTYQKYLEVLTAKGPDEVAKAKAKVTESYNNMASFYANSDKAKAIELLNKTLELDPTNQYAMDSLKILASPKK
jgi:tetratricopeptide (TPR) repeat protein